MYKLFRDLMLNKTMRSPNRSQKKCFSLLLFGMAQNEKTCKSNDLQVFDTI